MNTTPQSTALLSEKQVYELGARIEGKLVESLADCDRRFWVYAAGIIEAAAIAAYQAKLCEGVEIPEPLIFDPEYREPPGYTLDQLQTTIARVRLESAEEIERLESIRARNWEALAIAYAELDELRAKLAELEAQESANQDPMNMLRCQMMEVVETTRKNPGVAVKVPDLVATEGRKFMRGEPSLFDQLPFGEVQSFNLAAGAQPGEKA